MNKVFMVGRLVTDPSEFVTSNGIIQSRLTLATNDNWNKNETYFFPCISWQSIALYINKNFKKGDMVAIDGKLIRRSFINKEKKKVFLIDIVIESIKKISNSNISHELYDIDQIDNESHFSSENNNKHDTKKNNFLDNNQNINETLENNKKNEDLVDIKDFEAFNKKLEELEFENAKFDFLNSKTETNVDSTNKINVDLKSDKSNFYDNKNDMIFDVSEFDLNENQKINVDMFSDSSNVEPIELENENLVKKQEEKNTFIDDPFSLTEIDEFDFNKEK